ncbi:reverse transcriptase family protein [Sphingomonas sp.]|uniref:reverse transcriptase family protein n=1 Tax=Sphingomonas sp. TaxID=28214 RepID=UPI0025DB37FE|nr:reverse transcriptase family protein [Sphingomonas sp.]
MLGLGEAELRAMAIGPDRYRQFEIEKKGGGKRPVEDPVAPLKRVQGRIAQMLARIEPPPFLFCPVKGRCYVSNAARHRGNRVVHCLDIKKFFPSTPRVRVIAFFQFVLQCRGDVAGLLGDLCTFEGHLPTGSPLSPILAYYSYHDMWAEIAAFCASKGHTLTVYVDDVTISGAKVPLADVWQVRRMIHRTGLRYHKLKHYVDRPAEITGVIVRGGRVVAPNRQRLKHRKLLLALQQPGNFDQRLQGRLAGLAGQMRQIDGQNESLR